MARTLKLRVSGTGTPLLPAPEEVSLVAGYTLSTLYKTERIRLK